MASPRKRVGVVKVLLIVVGLVVAMFVSAVLAAMTTPAVPRVKAQAVPVKQARPQTALKPAVPLTPSQQVALEQYGRELALAINEEDDERLAQMQDAEALPDRVFSGLEDASDFVEARRRFVATTCKVAGGWLARQVKGEAVAFLRTRERLGCHTVLLRLTDPDGNADHVEVMVQAEGIRFKAVDMFVCVLATTLSQEERKVQALTMRHAKAAPFDEIFGVPTMDDTDLVRLEVAYAAFNRGKMEDVVRICDRLPEAVQTQRPFFLLRLQALMDLHLRHAGGMEKEYEATLRAAPDILGRESTIGLFLSRLLIAKKDLQGGGDCLKRVEAVLGGEPYLKILRGQTRMWMGDYAGALALADQAREEDSAMSRPASVLRLAVHLERNDHAATVKELRGHSNGPLERKRLAGQEKYRELLASSEFVAWEKETAEP